MPVPLSVEFMLIKMMMTMDGDEYGDVDDDADAKADVDE